MLFCLHAQFQVMMYQQNLNRFMQMAKIEISFGFILFYTLICLIFMYFFCAYLSQPKQQLRITSGAFEGQGNQQHEVAVVSFKEFSFLSKNHKQNLQTTIN